MSHPPTKPSLPSKPRLFAPLKPESRVVAQQSLSGEHGEELPELKGIVFDVDGTLCQPQKHMFAAMRSALGIHKPTDILNHIHSLPIDPPSPPSPTTPRNHRASALAAIRAIELDAMAAQTPKPGLDALMSYLEKRGVRRGLCTRNFPAPVRNLQKKFLKGVDVGPVITRETMGVRAKPSPEGLWVCAMVWAGEVELPGAGGQDIERGSEYEGVIDAVEVEHLVELASSLIMVGDSLDDMVAGRQAGAATILVASEETEKELLEEGEHEYVDVRVDNLAEIVDVLESGFRGRS